MYIPKHNAEADLRVIRDLAAQHPFATLIAPRAGGVEIAHLPVAVDGRGERLRVHVARANRIWRDVVAPDRPADVVVVFSGPHAYVSPTWYASPKDDVPTWNYAVAHAHVSAPTLLERGELVLLLDELAAAHEVGPDPWRLEEHPPASRERLLDAIVGIDLPVARWEAKLKLSQNRTEEDHARVVAALERRGGPDDLELAALMRPR